MRVCTDFDVATTRKSMLSPDLCMRHVQLEGCWVAGMFTQLACKPACLVGTAFCSGFCIPFSLPCAQACAGAADCHACELQPEMPCWCFMQKACGNAHWNSVLSQKRRRKGRNARTLERAEAFMAPLCSWDDKTILKGHLCTFINSIGSMMDPSNQAPRPVVSEQVATAVLMTRPNVRVLVLHCQEQCCS